MTKTCATCGTSIETRGNRRYCRPCAEKRAEYFRSPEYTRAHSSYRHIPKDQQKKRGRPAGFVVSAEHRAHLSEARRGLKLGPYSPEHRAAISAAKRGKGFSPEHRAKLAEAKRGTRHTAEQIAKIRAGNLGKSRNKGAKHSLEHIERRMETMSRKAREQGTTIEHILERFLADAGFRVERQRRFGRYLIDAYLPDYHVALEADGAYWHNRPGAPEKDAARDAELMRRFALPVVRLGEFELRDIGAALPHLAV